MGVCNVCRFILPGIILISLISPEFFVMITIFVRHPAGFIIVFYSHFESDVVFAIYGLSEDVCLIKTMIDSFFWQVF